MEQAGNSTMLVAADRLMASTPPRSTIHNNNRPGKIVVTPDRTMMGNGAARKTPQIPLYSPMIAKRIAPSTGTKDNSRGTRRRVIFPFLPKTPEEEPSSSFTCSEAPLPQSLIEQSSDISQKESPRLVSDGFGWGKVGLPTLPFMLPSPPVEPRLLARDSTLSSHEETPPCGGKNIASLQDSSSSSIEEEDASHPSAKNVQVVLPPSILRRSKKEKTKRVESVDSDLPSLAGSSQSDSCEELRRIFPTIVRIEQQQQPPQSKTRAVAFDPRVWVREFERAADELKVTWYSNKELECFKVAAVERIMAFSEAELVPTGTGRMVPKRKALFSHKALGADANPNREALFRAVLQNELRRILVVDSHEIFLNLYAKTLRPLLPHAEVVLADSAAAALLEAQKGRFDIILVEERLKPRTLNNSSQNAQQTTNSGSSLVPTDQESRSGATLMKRLQITQGRALYIGVSAKLREDVQRLQQASDICWSKPPPHMNAKLVSDLLHKLLVKRQRFQAVAELYSTTSSC